MPDGLGWRGGDQSGAVPCGGCVCMAHTCEKDRDTSNDPMYLRAATRPEEDGRRSGEGKGVYGEREEFPGGLPANFEPFGHLNFSQVKCILIKLQPSYGSRMT